MKYSELKSSFESVMKCENDLLNKKWIQKVMVFERVKPILDYVMEFIKSGTVSRSYNHERYNKAHYDVSPESVAAHTLALEILVDKALDFIFGTEFVTSNGLKDGFYRHDFIEVARRHDLPENKFGDIPDDGTRDDNGKGFEERDYWRNLAKYHHDNKAEQRIFRLLCEMQTRCSVEGRIIYLADKTIAILRALYEDKIGVSPIMQIDYPGASDIDRKAMMLSDTSNTGFCRASEMWTLSYFRLRDTVIYDDTGLFTALIVLMTLEVNESWYDWRVADYLR